MLARMKCYEQDPILLLEFLPSGINQSWHERRRRLPRREIITTQFNGVSGELNSLLRRTVCSCRLEIFFLKKKNPKHTTNFIYTRNDRKCNKFLITFPGLKINNTLFALKEIKISFTRISPETSDKYLQDDPVFQPRRPTSSSELW